VDAAIRSGTLPAVQAVYTGGEPVKVRFAVIAAAMVIAACGATPDEDLESQAGSGTLAGSTRTPDPAAAWVGTYRGTTTLSHGRFTWTSTVDVHVENPEPGIVRVPVREMCPSVDHVDFVPPEALVIVLAEAGAWSFQLPTGEKVRLGSIHPRFEADGRTLTIAFHGVVDGKDLEWTFVGMR
jgi:hypothetical protein